MLPYVCFFSCFFVCLFHRERSVVLELLKNVESHALTLPKDGHALALAAGLPSLSAAFSGSPVISGILGSPQFLKWSMSQTSVLAERVESIRRRQTSVCFTFTILPSRLFMICFCYQ